MWNIYQFENSKMGPSSDFSLTGNNFIPTFSFHLSRRLLFLWNKTIIASNKFIYLHVIVVVKVSRGTLNIMILVLRGLLTLKNAHTSDFLLNSLLYIST